MRAGRLFVLLLALSLVGITLIRPESVLPLAFDFVEPLLADPQPAPPPTTDATAKPDAAAAHPDGNLPKFVSGDRTLKFPGHRADRDRCNREAGGSGRSETGVGKRNRDRGGPASSSTGKDAASALQMRPTDSQSPDATPVSGPKRSNRQP